MLRPSEFFAGDIGDAIPLSFVMPRSENGNCWLIGSFDGKPYAVSLDRPESFIGFECVGNTNYGGLIIPKIQIEVDEKSVIDLGYKEAVAGTMVRRNSTFDIVSRRDRYKAYGLSVVLLDNLPISKADCGFTNWQITIGEGVDKRILFENITPINSAA